MVKRVRRASTSSRPPRLGVIRAISFESRATPDSLRQSVFNQYPTNPTPLFLPAPNSGLLYPSCPSSSSSLLLRPPAPSASLCLPRTRLLLAGSAFSATRAPSGRLEPPSFDGVALQERACLEFVLRVMLLTRSSTDAFGVLTISLVILFDVLAILCLYQVIYLRIRIRQQYYIQLSFFNGPWVARIFLVLVAIWWSLSEVARLSFLKGRLISTLTWQRSVCKIYILFNLGFSEPSVFLTLVFLLRASLQKRDSGTLSQGWNKKTIGYIFLYCLPIFVLQLILNFAGPRLFNESKSSGRLRKDNYFTKTSVLVGDDDYVCTYPLFSTIVLGLFHAALISYVVCIGIRVYISVINKHLLRRLYWLVPSIIISLPVRVLLLGFSIIPQPGSVGYELIVFLAFLIMLFCAVIGIIILVYLPATDSMALRNLEERQMLEVPYDDYYNDSASFVANQSCRDTRRSSDVSTKPGSVSFRTMIKDDLPGPDGFDDMSLSFPATLHIGSPSGSSSMPARSMLPLKEIPRF
ncbi:hypothetical protein ZIOFF_030664 [Zingiber officinale]|uniref:Transmembrane protein n=2 Tax=Zingiber officinale TaxID=94328 RepID=A0A8J5GVT5_ZINOF|nr:hypothetical protein ZIOFF_030664 [Zingiber officinale]